MRNFDQKKIKLFIQFLENSGAELLALTNEWEIVRFRANGETGIVYQNKMGELTFTGQSQNALDAFISKTSWSAQEKIKRKKKSSTITTLLKRDGNNCFYCSEIMEDGTETIEHLLSIKHGGNNHITNMALAHHACNLKAASLEIVGKIKLRDKLLNKEPLIEV